MSLPRGVPVVRRKIAVLLSRFPLITETFILREIIELERQGQPVLLVPMLRESPDVVHREARPWIERALFTPYLSISILAANLRMLIRRPLRYTATALEMFAGMLRSPRFLFRTMAIFPKSIYLAERLRAEEVVHIHAHFATHPATMALIISRLVPGMTFSFTAHAHDIFVDRTMLGKKLREAAAIRVISRFNRSYLSTLYPRISAAKIEVIHVGVEPHGYSGEPPRDEPVTRILCVAAFKPYKGLRVLVEACRILDGGDLPFVCQIIGDGPQRKMISDLISAWNLAHRVEILGPLPQDEVARLVKSASVFVLPSVVAADGQMEGIPVALMEAMAASRAVVATALSGIPELVENEVTGLLVDPNNPEQLAAAIGRLAADRSLREMLGQAARVRVTREFALERTVSQLLEFLDRNNPGVEQAVPFLLGLPEAGQAAGLVSFHQTRDSEVATLLLAGSLPQYLVVKHHRSREGQSRPPEQRAVFEHAVLRALIESAGLYNGKRLTVPAPRNIEKERAVLFMEHLPGERMDMAVRRARWSHDGLSALRADIEAAGAWLQWFHLTAPQVLDLEALRPEAREKEGAGIVHGDFWPGNIFISPGVISVVDFEGVDVGTPLDDVAWFLLHLDLFFRFPLRRRQSPLRDAFLHGYYGEGEVPHQKLQAAQAGLARAMEHFVGEPTLRAALKHRQMESHLERRSV